MDFAGDIGLFQRRVAECPGGVAQRLAVIQSLSLVPGHAVIDIGCGGGHMVREFALAIGNKGRVIGLDVSKEQVDSASNHCHGLEVAECHVGDVTNMTFGDACFNQAASIRTLEYVDDVSAALAEIHRVLKPGGLVAMVSVLWDHFRFHGANTQLNDKILDAFRAHCPHQMLPMTLPKMLANSGFSGAAQKPVTIFETSLNENSYGYWVSKLVAAFVVGECINKADAELWLNQLQQAADDGSFGFISMPVLTVTSVPI
jgi:arsenite methyltransferase